jgi:DNA-binding SARP family transcriptional activator
VQVEFGVLGPVTAWDAEGDPIPLKGPRHRAVLARLLVARGRVVPLAMLVDDLWVDPPPDAVGAIRTFVGDLRRALEPERRPRAPARLLVTEGPGYALRSEPTTVDALRFERAVDAARTVPPDEAVETLDRALAWWRGPGYADFADEHWARTERSRLTELRLHAVELRGAARLDLGLAAEAVPDLDAHASEHPWREEGWRLLALALYRSGRQAEALEVLRRARGLLVTHLGVDPGPALRQLETDILHQADRLDADAGPDSAARRVWAQASATYHRTVAPAARARLRSTVDLLRSLAVTGGSGLEAARELRLATILAAEELGDTDLTARVIGAYDVPAIWSRADDPEQAARIVAAAERTLAALPADARDATRARLLATIAIESRGDPRPRGRSAAEQAESIARRMDDPALLAFALNGVFMQTFHRAGLADRRDAIGAELVALSGRHGLTTYELLGHLIRLQARSAIGDLAGADEHASAADRLAEQYESPLVGVFTQWYRALRLALTDRPPADVAAAYRSAAMALEGAGMPGVQRGLLPLALLTLRVRHHRPAPTDEGIDWGPYVHWVRPLVLLARGLRADAAVALQQIPEPPPDHLFEALWCLTARAAIALDDRDTMRRAQVVLAPAAAEHAGAGSGMLSLGPVSGLLDELT